MEAEEVSAHGSHVDVAAAKARGVRFGRPKRELPDNFAAVCVRWQQKEITLQQAAKACQLPVSTFYDKARQKNIQSNGFNKAVVHPINNLL